MTELHALTATELGGKIRVREVSRREVVEAHLQRIALVNGAVNAIVEQRIPEQLIAEADSADANHAARASLPLDGIPVSIKDHFDVKGMKHTEGVRLHADRRSPGTSLAVARLQEAGALVIGKANQPDYAIRWNTVNDVFGATVNPRDPSLTAGGSSGGDAAAVAAGIAPLGLGADYGGSIRVPAGWCGIYGLRPSGGRVANVQSLPPAAAVPTATLMNSIGPLGRSPADLWAALLVLSGADPRDPSSLAVAAPPPGSVAPKLRVVARVCGESGALVEPEVEQELDRVCAILADAGYGIVEGGLPGARRLPELWGDLVCTEFLEFAMPHVRDDFAPSGRQHVEMMHGRLLSLGNDLSAYVGSWVERHDLAARVAVWMEDHPLVVAPIAGMPAPPLDFDHMLSLDATRDLFDRMRNVLWVNVLGLPSIALPNGIQIIARRFREAEALAAAEVCAQAFGSVPVAPADVLAPPSGALGR